MKSKYKLENIKNGIVQYINKIRKMNDLIEFYDIFTPLQNYSYEFDFFSI